MVALQQPQSRFNCSKLSPSDIFFGESWINPLSNETNTKTKTENNDFETSPLRSQTHACCSPALGRTSPQTAQVEQSLHFVMTRLFTGFVSVPAIFGGSFLTLIHTVIISRFCKLSVMVPDRKDLLRCEWLNIPYKINVASVEVTNKTWWLYIAHTSHVMVGQFLSLKNALRISDQSRSQCRWATQTTPAWWLGSPPWSPVEPPSTSSSLSSGGRSLSTFCIVKCKVLRLNSFSQESNTTKTRLVKINITKKVKCQDEVLNENSQ